MTYRALKKEPHRRYLTEFRICLRVKRKEKYLYIGKCNNVRHSRK